MLSELDHGLRCETHVGEVFPPRCRECDSIARGHDASTSSARFAPHAGEDCPEHPGYPHPESRFGCDRHRRDASGVTP